MTDVNADRPGPVGPAGPIGTGKPKTVPHTRMGAAWFGICLAALVLVVLIVFMMQNTGPVEVTFLGLHGTLPLSLGLLIAAVGGSLVTAVIAIARLTQLRRLSHRR